MHPVLRTTALLAALLVPAPAAPAAARDEAPAPAWVAPVRPLDVGRAFDPPETDYGAGHRGVDLRAAEGTTVVAAGAGRVAYATLLAGRGVVVVVHDRPGGRGLRTTYEPVTAAVPVGALVDPGDPLGRLDRATGPHRGCGCLHWGLRRGDSYLDPLLLLRRGPSVLLPLSAADRSAARGAGLLGDPAPGPGRVLGPVVPAPPVRPSPPARWLPLSERTALGAGLALALALLLLLRRRSRRSRPPGPRPGTDSDPDPASPPLQLALALPWPEPETPARARTAGTTRRHGDGVVRALPLVPRPQGCAAPGPAPVDLAAERLRRRAG